MLKKLLTGKTDSTFVQLVRYTFVGGLAFVVDFCVLAFLTECFGLYYLHSAALAFSMGLATNYLLSVFWVFKDRRVESKALEFFVFALLAVSGLGVNQFLMYFFTETVGCHYLFSKGFATGITFWWNFASRKVILFSSRGVRQSDLNPDLAAAESATGFPLSAELQESA
ncbi:MAG: GtrA family protein [Gemmataceae bacterium]|nr:GtrA family protein [Gemmataceae bacterium]